MKGYLKTGTVVAAAFFVIAFILGLLSGNGFGVILLRALLSAAVAGGAAGGVHLLLAHFVPELFAEGDSNDRISDIGSDLVQGAPNPGPGSNVNIVIDDEQDSEEFDTQGAESTPQKPRHQASELEEMVEEVAEDSDTVTEIADEAPEESGFDEEAFYSGVDSLPDISGFEDSFSKSVGLSSEEEDSGSGDVEDSVSGGSPSQGSSSSSQHGDMDPVMIARAIQTALKKEK
ncbi:hypothetical protein [Spirochaeta lutea]|uniref:Uncharacterized protein n=1 Tax=Spirochaeta lutea TaxID=1480694 RepID=A0A098R457_9SPIO|nr:hypothetical protein [Spirochaeta lutea]KGE73542.1 hypothetical protein DC28_02440 [Spirochaeta lutea]